MARPESLRPFALAAMVAVVVAAVWGFTAPGAAMPPVSPLGEQPTYSVADDTALALLEPVLHAPWLGTVTVPARWIVGIIVILGATGVAIFAGASLLATLFIALALVLDVSFGAALSHAGGLVVAVGLVWLASGAAFDEHQRVSPDRPWFNPLSAILLWSAAVWWDWIAIVTWPIVLAALRRTPHRPARGWWTVTSVLLGMGAFLAHFDWMATETRALSLAPGVSLTWLEALIVAFGSRPRMPIGSFVSADLTMRLAYLVMALAAIGLAFGDLDRWWRRAVGLSGALVLSVVIGWPEWQAEVVRFSIWALAPLAAVGLTWVSRQSPRPEWAPAITCLLGAVLLAETVVMGARPLAGTDARVFRDALESALNARASGRRMVIAAEDTRIDSAVVSWASGQGVLRVAQDGDAVAGAVKDDHLVLAGPSARRNLELTGIVFAEAFTISEPVSFTVSEATATLQCATVRADRWSQLPGLEYTGRLGLQLPRQLGGELQLIVGDALPIQLHAQTPDGRDLPVTANALMTGPGRETPPPDFWLDGGLPENGPAFIRRVHVPASPARTTVVSLRLGRRAPRVLARLIGYDDVMRGRVCAAPLGRATLFADDRRNEAVSLANDELFGTGWYGIEGPADRAFRWAGTDAVVLLSSAMRTDVTVTLDAEVAARGSAADDAGAAELTLRVNGVAVAAQPMGKDEQRYTWKVPAGVWLAGTNELWWHTSRAVRPADTGGTDTRALALRVSSIVVERD